MSGQPSDGPADDAPRDVTSRLERHRLTIEKVQLRKDFRRRMLEARGIGSAQVPNLLLGAAKIEAAGHVHDAPQLPGDAAWRQPPAEVVSVVPDPATEE